MVGFHVGDKVEHTSQGYTGWPVAIDTHRRRPTAVEDPLRAAGFTIEANLVLRPDDDIPGAVIFATSSSKPTLPYAGPARSAA